jgi:two-component system, cell cycle sensor histidine kinase and response regulator CckA
MAQRNSKNRTILVVEDEQSVLTLVRRVLQSEGYDVLGAVTGPAAHAIWKEKKNAIDLALLDFSMPDGITGRMLAENFHKDKPSLKVIFTSGYSSDVIPSAEQRKSDFLQKPFQADELLAVVQRSLELS